MKASTHQTSKGGGAPHCYKQIDLSLIVILFIFTTIFFNTTPTQAQICDWKTQFCGPGNAPPSNVDIFRRILESMPETVCADDAYASGSRGGVILCKDLTRVLTYIFESVDLFGYKCPSGEFLRGTTSTGQPLCELLPKPEINYNHCYHVGTGELNDGFGYMGLCPIGSVVVGLGYRSSSGHRLVQKCCSYYGSDDFSPRHGVRQKSLINNLRDKGGEVRGDKAVDIHFLRVPKSELYVPKPVPISVPQKPLPRSFWSTWFGGSSKSSGGGSSSGV